MMACAVCAFLISLIAYNFIDIDTWHEMALIRESLAAGHLLKTDPYAYTPTVTPMVDHEWGAGVIAYGLVEYVGPRSLILLKFLIAFATFAIAGASAYRAGGRISLILVLAPVALYLAQFGYLAVLRAQVYTFLFTAVLFYCLERDRSGNRTWALGVVLTFPLWVNLHGGFVVGLGLVALHLCEQIARRQPSKHLIMVLLGMIAMTALNPYGIAFYKFLGRAVTMPRPYAGEWQPIWYLGTHSTWIVLAAMGVAAYAFFRRGFAQCRGILLLAAVAFEAVPHRKLLPLFAIGWLCLVPGWLQGSAMGNWIIRFVRRRTAFVFASSVAVVVMSFVMAVHVKIWRVGVPESFYPVGAVRYLSDHQFRGNVMTPFRVGSYVSWKLYPAVKVSLDSRYEVAYREPVTKDVFDFYAGRNWQVVLERYPSDMILVPEEAPVAELIAHSDWTRVYWDTHFTLYGKPDSNLKVVNCTGCTFEGSFP
jgi:hypothetical protein